MEREANLLYEFRSMSFEAIKGMNIQDLDDFFFNLGMLPNTAKKMAIAVKMAPYKEAK